MTKRNVGARARMSGVSGDRRRGALLLSTALGCSLLVVAAAAPAKAQVSQHVDGDIAITQEVVNGEPFAIDVISDTGDVTVDVGQVNVTNNGDGSGYGVSAVTFAPDKLISISVDEVTATGTGRIFGVAAQGAGGSAVLINAGAVEASGDGGYGIWGATQEGGSITIDSGTVTTTGGIRNPGTENARNAYGVWALSDSGDIDVTSDSVTTTGFGASGIFAQTESGDVVVDSGEISTAQTFSSGIVGMGDDITITSDSIEASGDASAGIYVPVATGDVTVTSGEITTAGQTVIVDGVPYLTPGVAIRDGENVSVTSEQVTTTGNGGYGLAVDHVGSLTLVSGTVRTSGVSAKGVNVEAVTGAISITSESVATEGEAIEFDGGFVGSDAIFAQGEGAITIDSGTVSTKGALARGVVAQSGEGAISVTSEAVTTTGFAAAGITGETDTGDVVVNSGTVSTAQDLAPGVSASGHNITITSEDITTAGDGSPGIYVPVATGDVTIDSGTISTAGGLIQVGDETYISPGIAVVDGENVTITSDQITTSGGGGFGIAVEDVATISITSGQIDTSGDAATGITAGADGAISITSESITTVGGPVEFDGEWVAGEGIFAETNGPITIDSGTISTQGELAHGILAEGGEGAISITSGEVSTSGVNAQGILATTSSGDITINAGTTTTSGDYNGDLLANPYNYFPDAVTAITDSGAISITSETASSDGFYASAVVATALNGGTIVIDSGSASGSGDGGVVLQGDASYGLGSTVTINSDSIVNEGDGKASLVAIATGDVSVKTGTIVSTGGDFYDGVLEETLHASGVAAHSYHGDVAVESGSISTVGDFAVGVWATADEGSLTLTSGTVTTQSARGIMASAAGDITIDSGSIHAAVPEGGQGAHAIMVTAGEGEVAITSDEIVTEGSRTHGVYVANADGEDVDGIGEWRAATGGTGTLTIDSGSIEAGGYGMMIDHQGAIDITSGSIVSEGPGIYLYGGDAVTIDSGSLETANGPGIVVWGDEALVQITSDNVLVGAGGDVGIVGRTTSGDVIIDAGVTETAATGLLFDFYPADGVFGWSDTGNVTITSEAVKTQGLYSTGVYAVTGGDVTVTSGSVESSGVLANGVLAQATGDVSVESGSITMSGAGAWGMYVQADGAVSIVSDSIVTTGAAHDEDDGIGMAVDSDSQVDIVSGLVSTKGDGALGIHARTSGDLTLDADEVSTSGVTAHGIYLEAANADVTVGDVTATGDHSHGLVVVTTEAANINVTGDISVGEGGWGIAAVAGEGFDIDLTVASGASVHGGLGAIVLDGENDVTLTVGGHLSGDGEATVLLTGGDDVVNLVTGANVIGAIDAGAGHDVLNLNSTDNSGAGIGQSVDAVVGFEALNVANGRWTVGGDMALETTLSGGTLVITGTLTDDLTIGQLATLQIGDGGASGALAGDLAVEGTVIFNRSDEYDFGGAISGAGSLVKEGASRLVLSGAYDFTGATVVNGGTIKILQLPQTAEMVVDDGVLDLSGQEQELASLSGGAGGQVNVEGGSLTVNQTGATEFAGAITGDGSLTLSGGGTLNLTGANTYTGSTNVNQGTLKVNGSITSSVTVNGGGVLGGSGTIDGDVEVGAGGMVGPGNSPGLLTVDGDFTLAAGSTYVAEVEADGAHDQIDASGEFAIEDDVTLSIMAGDGDYARLSSYTLVTAGAVTGEFETVETNLAFLDPHVEYTDTAVELHLTRNDIAFASFAANANQTAVAEVLEAAGLGDPLYDAVVVQSAEGSRAAYTALSGELYASLPTVLIQQARHGREAILGRIAEAPEGQGVWGEVVDTQLRLKPTPDNARVESEGEGLTAGADMAANGWRAGVAVSHLKSDIEAASLDAVSEVKSTTVSAYAGTRVGPFRATAGASYARHDIDAARTVAFPGFADATTADFDATSVGLFAELALSQRIDGVFLEPFIGVGYTALDVDGFAEEGGDAALTVADVERNVTTATIGVRASGSFESALGTVTPHASFAFQGVAGDDDAVLDAAFAGAGGYTIAGAPAEEGLAFDVGVRLDRGRLGVSASYAGVSGDNWDDQRLKLGLSFRF